jgi:hypothetical protein
MIANFMADIFEHPRMQTVAANAIVAGMNATADQPDLPERAATIYLKLQEQNEHVSRQLGEQFPKVAASFLAGAAAGLRKKEKKPEENKKAEAEKAEASTAPNTPLRVWGNLFNNKKEGEKKKEKKSDDDAGDDSSLLPLIPVTSFQSHASSDAASVEGTIKNVFEWKPIITADTKKALENKKES